MRSACLGLLALIAAALAEASEKLVACTEEADFPPFTYVETVGGQRQVSGSSAQMLAALAREIKHPVDIVMTSLKRCLRGLEKGAYDIGLDFVLDAERLGKFDHSPAYRVLQPYYYFDRSRHPGGLNVRGRADLKNYRGCGITGYSYADYELRAGPGFDVAAQSHVQLGRMLFAGRCDYFPSSREVIDGYRAIGESELSTNPNLGAAPVADVPLRSVHLLYSRHSAAVQKLRPAIDAFVAARRKAVRPGP